jgi:hypothetical protein
MTESASERIKRHGGIGDGEAVNPLTVAGATGRGDGVEIDAATADLVAALADFNYEVNGATPSMQVSGVRETMERDVVYAVAESVRMLREAAAAQLVEDVETAWLAVLAGDIDDVREHVALERRFRSVG